MTAIQEAFLNHRIGEIIREDHQEKLYSPVAVCLVARYDPVNKEPEFLLVHDRYGYDYCVQGRIRPAETATEAVRRKVWEEAGIFNVSKIRFLFHERLPYLLGRPKRDGFALGKDYLVFGAELDGGQLKSFSSPTIVNCYWLTLAKLISLAESIEPTKANLLYRGLEILGYHPLDPDISFFA